MSCFTCCCLPLPLPFPSPSPLTFPSFSFSRAVPLVRASRLSCPLPPRTSRGASIFLTIHAACLPGCRARPSCGSQWVPVGPCGSLWVRSIPVAGGVARGATCGRGIRNKSRSERERPVLFAVGRRWGFAPGPGEERLRKGGRREDDPPACSAPLSTVP